MLDYFKNRMVQNLMPIQDGKDEILVEFELGGPRIVTGKQESL